MRAHESSRLESFSDAVFGFALTLLVVSVEVPKTFDDLLVVVRGFLPFVTTFATISWLWYEHYVFFRTFSPADRLTIVLNCALLFFVLFYVYPLKFLYTLVVGWLMGDNAFGNVFSREGDGVRLMTIYGLGFIFLFIIFALLYANVWRQRAKLRLTPIETHDARTGTVSHLLAACVGVLSVLIVQAGGDRSAMWSGLCYALLGPALGTWGFIAGGRRSRLEREANLTV